MDNIFVTSVHGLSRVNHGGYGFLYKGFQILSIDHTRYSSVAANNQVFNFNSYDCDQALGRKDWNGEVFAMFVGDLEEVIMVKLY